MQFETLMTAVKSVKNQAAIFKKFEELLRREGCDAEPEELRLRGVRGGEEEEEEEG